MIGRNVVINAFNDQYSGQVYKIVDGKTYFYNKETMFATPEWKHAIENNIDVAFIKLDNPKVPISREQCAKYFPESLGMYNTYQLVTEVAVPVNLIE